MQAVDRAHVVALVQRRSGNDRQQPRFLRENPGPRVAGFAVESHGASFKTPLQSTGHLDPGDTIAAGLVFQQFGTDDLHAVAPIAAHANGSAIVLQDLHGLIPKLTQHRGIGSAQTHLNASAGAGSEKEFFGDGVGVGITFVELFLNGGDQPLNFAGVIHIDQELDISAVLVLGRINEQETQAAAADEGGDIGHAGLALHEALDFSGHRLGFADMSARGKKDIHHELRPCGRREKALIHLAESKDRSDEGEEAKNHDHPAEAQGPHKQFPVDLERKRLVGVAVPAFPRARQGLEHEVAQKRSGGDRRDPAQAQRDHDDPEERVGVFAGGVLRQADGGEGDHADGGRAEERPHVFGDHLADHFEFVAARFDADFYALDDNDGVVREHAQRDDEGAEGDALHQQIALQIHDKKRRHDGEKEDQADDEAGLAAHGENQDHEDDGDGLAEVEHELADGLGNRLGLEIDLADLDADRLIGFQLFELLPKGFPHRDNVATRDRGDAQTDGRVAIVAQQATGRILIAALQRGDVPQAKLTPGRIRTDDQIEHVIGRGECPRRVDRNVLVAHADAAAVGGDIPFLEFAVDHLLIETQLRQPLTRDFEKDDFALFAKERDAFHSGHLEQLAAEELPIAAQFGKGESVARDGEENAINIPEIVHHHGLTPHRRRQLRLHVGDLAPQFVPDLRHALPIVVVLDGDGHNRPATGRFRFDVVELPQSLTGDLKGIGDFLRDFLGTGPRIRRNDQRLFDGELRIFQPSDIHIRHDAADNGQGHSHQDHAVVFNRKLAGVHGWRPPRASPRSRTFIPSRKKVTPATAMRSPGSSPSTISICPPLASPVLTGRRVTV